MKLVTHLTRFAGMILMLGALTMASCTSDEYAQEPDGPVSPAETRRGVLLTLDNKLALQSSPTSRAPIATAAENTISTLDVYAFGSDTEDGLYTYQSRFAYRADGSKLPTGAVELLLEPGADGATTTGLLSLKKGKFVKLYCIANDVLAGKSPVETDQPQLDEFLKQHTALLRAGDVAEAAADTLATPLTMSGAHTTPLDLTDPDASTRLQVGIKLTRLAARFDIVNNAERSKFTITSVSMGNARCGATYFPISAVGSTPAAPGELITTAARPFNVKDANAGTAQGAFYSYSSAEADGGYLILKGTYKANETQTAEPVTYQVPFRQQLPGGGEMYIDINHNHRYVITISDADPDRLDFNVTVADWTDDGNIDDYEPENRPGELTVTIPQAFETLTEATLDPARNVYTVKMSLQAGSTFDVHIGATSPLQLTSTYAGGVGGQQYNWLTISEPTQTRVATATYTYHFSLTDGYLKGRYPRVTVRIADQLSGSEAILYIEAVAAPQPIVTPQPPKAPNAESQNPNAFDVESQTATLFRITDSQALVTISSPDGTVLESKPDWVEVTKVKEETPNTTYLIKLKDREVVPTEDTPTVVFHNTKVVTLKTNINLLLKDAAVKPDFTAVGAGNTYVPSDNPDVPDDITLNVKEGNSSTVRATSMDGVTVAIDYHGGPEWFTFSGAQAATIPSRAIAPLATTGTNTIGTTRANEPSTIAAAAAPGDNMKKQENIVFNLNNAKLHGAKLATVTLNNKIGGLNTRFTITPKLNLGTFEKVSSVPVDDVILNNTITLYKLPVMTSKMNVKVVSYGGSTLSSDNDCVTVTKTPASRSSSVGQEENAAFYTLTANSVGTATLTLTNKTDPTKSATYAVNVLSSEITGTFTIDDLTAVAGQSKFVTLQSPKGFNVAITDYGQSSSGGAWLTANQTSVDGGANKTVSVTVRSSLPDRPDIVRPVTITLTNKIVDGGDQKIIVTPTYPAPVLTSNGESSPSQNTLSGNTIKLYQVSGSEIGFTATSVGGSFVRNATGVLMDGGNTLRTANRYTVKLNSLETTSGSFEIVNKSNESKVTKVTVVGAATVIGTKPANYTLDAINGTTATVAVNFPEGFTIPEVGWDGGTSWFTFNNPVAGAHNVTTTARFTGGVIKPATVTLKNKIAGGTDYTYTVTPVFQKPVMAFDRSNPTCNTFDPETNIISLYRMAPESIIRLKFNNLMGGAKVWASDNVIVTRTNDYEWADNGIFIIKLKDLGRDGWIDFGNSHDSSKKATRITVKTLLGETTLSTTTANVDAVNGAVNNIAKITSGGVTASVDWGDGGSQWFDITKGLELGNNIDFQITQRNNNNITMKPAIITLTSKLDGIPVKTITVTPVFKAPTMVYDSSTPVCNNFNSGTNTITLYRLASGSSIKMKYSDLAGGARVVASSNITATRAGAEKANSDVFTLKLINTANGGWVDFGNSHDDTKKATRITVNSLQGETIISATSASVNAVNGAVNALTKITSPGVTATMNWNGGDQWFDVTGGLLSGVNMDLQITQRANNNVTMKPAIITLTSKLEGIPAKTFTVTPVFSAPTMVYESSTPACNTMANNVINLYQLSTGSSVNVKYTNLAGGVKVVDRNNVTVTRTGTEKSSSDVLTISLTSPGSGGWVEFGNSHDATKKAARITVNSQLGEIVPSTTSINVNAANGGYNTIATVTSGGASATVNWGSGGGQWFDILSGGVGAGTGQTLMILQRNNFNTIMKPATITLTSGLAGIPSKTITVTPVNFPTPQIEHITMGNVVNLGTTTKTVTILKGNVGGYTVEYGATDRATYTITNNVDAQNATLTARAIKKTNDAYIIFRNASDPTKRADMYLNVKRDYKGQPVYYYAPLFLTSVQGGAANPTDATNVCGGSTAGTATGAQWLLPTWSQIQAMMSANGGREGLRGLWSGNENGWLNQSNGWAIYQVEGSIVKINSNPAREYSYQLRCVYAGDSNP